MDKAWSAYVKNCHESQRTPVERADWPSGLPDDSRGAIHGLLGIGSINFNIIFEYQGVVFMDHNLRATNKIIFGGKLKNTVSEAIPCLFSQAHQVDGGVVAEQD